MSGPYGDPYLNMIAERLGPEAAAELAASWQAQFEETVRKHSDRLQALCDWIEAHPNATYEERHQAHREINPELAEWEDWQKDHPGLGPGDYDYDEAHEVILGYPPDDEDEDEEDA
jgi:hypothetical protein